MSDTSNTASHPLKIGAATFHVPLRYAAGHVLNEAEASVLNQTHRENLSNNFRAKVAKYVEDHPGADVSKDLAEDFAKHVADYQFGIRKVSAGGSTRTTDPVEREAKTLILEALKQQITKSGQDVKAYGAEQLRNKVAEVYAHPEKGPKWREKALRVINLRREASELEVDDASPVPAPEPKAERKSKKG